jgi:hypothetical protein
MDTLLMAQQLQTISIEAAGFGGINTQDSPTSIDTSFARKANNCIIDKFGRIGARKGTRKIDSIDATTILAPVVSAFEFIDPDGNDIFLLSHNNKVYSHELGGATRTLTNPIASGGTFPDNHIITTSDWKIISLQDHAFFFSRDQEPLIWFDDGGTYQLEPFSSHAHATGNAPYANEAVAAYGRVWAADVTGSKSTVYWTDLLNGHAWSGGTSGSLDLTTVWNTGHDEITALAAHNGFLVIFGRHSIVIYSGAESPASMVLEDVIEGIGCVARDSVQNTGSDIVFLSANGLRSLGRTIQEKSVAIGDLSSNVRDDLLASLDRNTGDVKSIYSPKDGFYLLSIPDEDIVYCFDLKQRLPNGSAKTTTWSQIQPYGFCLDRENNLYISGFGGFYIYDTYTDINQKEDDFRIPYFLEYESNPMDFGNSSNLKFLKKLETSVVGNVGENSILSWYYDYDPSTVKIRAFSPPDAEPTAKEFSAVPSSFCPTAFNSTGWVSSSTPSSEVSYELNSAHIEGLAKVYKVLRDSFNNNLLITGNEYVLTYTVDNAPADGTGGRLVVKTGTSLGGGDGSVSTGYLTDGGYSNIFTATDNDIIVIFEGVDAGQTVSVSSPAIREVSKFTVNETAGYVGSEYSAPLNETGYVGSEYSSGLLVQTPSTQGSGSGKVITIGLKATIDGSPYSIQRIDVQVLLGRAK